MWLNLEKIFDRLSKDSNIRSIVLSGKGDKAFCAGLDVRLQLWKVSGIWLTDTRWRQRASHRQLLEAKRRLMSVDVRLRRVIISSNFRGVSAQLSDVRSVSKVVGYGDNWSRLIVDIAVIVVLHGWSFGLAIDISCCADVRICSQNTKFSVSSRH